MMKRILCPAAFFVILCAGTVASAAVTIDANKSMARSTSSTTIATPTFSTGAGNELLLAFIATDGPTGGTTTVNSVAGAGLTWVLVVRANGQPGTTEIWRAFAPTPLANVSVTATLSRSVAASITVLTFTGVDISGANGASAVGAIGSRSASTGAQSASLVTTRDNSSVLGVGNDWDAATVRTPTSGQSIVSQYLATNGDTYWVQKQDNPTPTAGTTVAISDTAPINHSYNLAIVEVVPTGSSGPTWNISGSVTPPANGSGTTLTLAGTTTTADANGNFTFGGLTAGSYTITPSKTGFIFTPASKAVSVSAGDVNGVNFAAAIASAPSGQWSAPFDLGIVAVNAVLMHTGKVLLYSGSYAGSWVERVWDPVTGTITLTPNPYYNLFCAGQAQLPDGRILVVGGYDPPSLGAANANIFDPATQSWSALPNMAYRRWYPTATTLPDGRMLVTSGGQSCLTCLADLPEIFDPATGRFTTITTARLAVPYYPFMFVLPDGSVVDAGANEQKVATSKLNVSTGTWTSVDPVVRDGHSAAMYLPGKIIKSGTAADSGTSGSAAATAFVIDMNQPTPSWRPVASLANARAFHNTTLLPDGTVLVTGGGTMLDGYDITKSVFAAELWTPATETWQTLASASIPRLYHSTALLLPDGRVLNAGSGNDGPAVNQTQAQIFSPPYLFKGNRPTIAGAPDTLQYGAAFSVQTPDSASIASVSLIRPGAATHGFDEDQRFLPLSFSAASGVLTIQAPANANLAPPGYYMLFLVNSNGVPSVATFVHFDTPGTDSIPPSAPANLSGQASIGTAALTWTASTDNTGVALYNVHRSMTSGFTPSTANRIGQPTTTSFTNSVGTAGTYFYKVTAQDVAGNVSAPSNEAAVAVLGDTAAPVVSVTAPADQATVTGAITVSATASDNVGVVGVQFQLDGTTLGAERATPPYTFTWDSSSTSNAAHTLSAVARDAAGNRTTATVNVTVSNTSSTLSGIVAAYGFNEGTGSTTRDSSGQGNVGTLAGAIWTPNGKFGPALSFDGTSAWVTIADANSLDLTNGMTMEAWVNPTVGTGWRAVAIKESSGGLAYALYSANNGSRPDGYVHTTNDVGVTGTAAVPLNTWTHLAITYDGASLRMYVNGILVKTTPASGAAAVSASPLRIGGDSVWGEYFRGLIDEVRIYNRALTGGEIQTDMATPVP